MGNSPGQVAREREPELNEDPGERIEMARETLRNLHE